MEQALEESSGCNNNCAAIQKLEDILADLKELRSMCGLYSMPDNVMLEVDEDGEGNDVSGNGSDSIESGSDSEESGSDSDERTSKKRRRLNENSEQSKPLNTPPSTPPTEAHPSPKQILRSQITTEPEEELNSRHSSPLTHSEQPPNNSLHSLYQKYVIDRQHVTEKTGTKTLLELYCHTINEFYFVNSMKPTGELSNMLMDIMAKEWNSKWNDRVILSQFAVGNLTSYEECKCKVPCNCSKWVKSELSPDKLRAINLIFVPVLYLRPESTSHWFLIVFDIRNFEITMPDSLPCPRLRNIAKNVIWSLSRYLQMNLPLDQFNKVEDNLNEEKVKRLSVQKQKDRFSCGFHVLLYINHFGTKSAENITEIPKNDDTNSLAPQRQPCQDRRPQQQPSMGRAWGEHF